jgi:hypothetical protein
MRRLGYSIEVTMLNRATEKAIESLYRNKLGTTWMCLRRKICCRYLRERI